MPIALIAGLFGWLGSIGLGGRMPVGGDVTQFSAGLMAELGRSVREARLPVWNAHWGFGFPGLAESQMGVYYPPHIVLYGLLPVELAYVTLLVLHTLWAGLGAAWAGRVFGASARGAALGGFAWATGGFFLIHLPHQWGASTASWMPWAWGLAWKVARGRGGMRDTLGLAAVLAIQIFPGHFQLAFMTEVTAALIGLIGLSSPNEATGVAGGRRGRAILLASAFLAVLPLSIAQLGPTAELASLASSQRSVAYLSAFPATPIHLVGYVAPGLFHESPLWRPLAWDAFHAMPEELRPGIGLVPLFLATIAAVVGRGSGRWTLLLTFTITTILSLGPYVPGFTTLCRLPGFSFFRAPARWDAAASLALALLAARGWDACRGLVRPGRPLRRFVFLATLVPLAVVALIELGLAATESLAGRPAWPSVAAAIDRVGSSIVPWRGDPSPTARLREARLPSDDFRVILASARLGEPTASPAERTLVRRRWNIYARELGPTAVALVALLLVSSLAGRNRRSFELALVVIMLAEVGVWRSRIPIDLGPIRPIAEQSPTLGRLAAMPPGTRSFDPLKNLPMVAGAAPLSAYRTLDLPAAPGLLALSEGRAGPDEAARALRGVGAGVLITSAVGGTIPPTGWSNVEELSDPTLLSWLTGADWVASLGDKAPATFSIWRPPSEPARAWFVYGSVTLPPELGDDPRSALATLDRAKPIAWSSDRPDVARLVVDAGGPGSLVLAQLDYPRWRATVGGKVSPIARAFGGWQAVPIPGAGRWEVEFRYDASRDWACLAVSGLAWGAWGLLYWRGGRSRIETRASTATTETGR